MDKVFKPSAEVETQLALGVAEYLLIATELHEVHARTGADERMPAAALPVVIEVQPDRDGSQRRDASAVERRAGPADVGSQADARCDVVLVQHVEQQRVVHLGSGWNERSDIDANRGRPSLWNSFLCRSTRVNPNEQAERHQSNDESFHLSPPSVQADRTSEQDRYRPSSEAELFRTPRTAD